LILAALAIVAVLLHLAHRRELAPALALARLWTRARPGVLGYLASAPATFIYLAIVATTTWVLVGVSAGTAESILHQHSSNLHELGANPVKALIRSAFLLDDYAQLASTALLAIVLAPVERWLGTARWLVVFATGHAGATIMTGIGIWVAIRTGHASRSLETTVDVGVSYGFAAIGGILTWGLTRRRARLWAIAVGSALAIALVVSQTYTDVGHVAAFAIGLALRPLAIPVADDDERPDPFTAAGRLAGWMRGGTTPTA
jgi:hypothetical protein